jgi:hypothetical protein
MREVSLLNPGFFRVFALSGFRDYSLVPNYDNCPSGLCSSAGADRKKQDSEPPLAEGYDGGSGLNTEHDALHEPSRVPATILPAMPPTSTVMADRNLAVVNRPLQSPWKDTFWR